MKFTKIPQSELELGEGIEPLRALENGFDVKVKVTTYDSIGVDLPEHVKLVEDKINQRGGRK